MSEVLYRKYRSKSFSELQGQDDIVKVLRQSLTTGKIAHAYLFTGPRGTGKTTTARLLAKALNCTNFSQHNDVCNKCENCLRADKAGNLSLLEIDAASHRGIDEIRQIKESVEYSGGGQEYKVYIIDEVHMLTKEAFNALLKTLEEPPAHVVFILATTEPHKVPITILSRVQRFDFKLATLADLSSKLQSIIDQEGYTITAEALKLVYTYSGGSYRDAETLLGKIIQNIDNHNKNISEVEVGDALGLVEATSISNLLELMLKSDIEQSLGLSDKLHYNGVVWDQVVKQLVFLLQDNILEKLKLKQNYNAELILLKQLMTLPAEFKLTNEPYISWQVFMLGLSNVGNSAGLATQPPAFVPQTNSTSSSANSATKMAPLSTEEVKNNPTDDSPKPTLPQPNVEVGDIKPAKTNKASSGVNIEESQWDAFLKAIKTQDLKLWTLMKASKLEIINQNIVINTRFQSLAQDYGTAHPVLVSAINQVFGEMRYTFNVDEDAVSKAVIKSAAPTAATSSSSSPHTDNTDLVESILI